MDYMYKHSILGGTFDHLHLGHQKLINIAFGLSEEVTIGLTKPSLYQDKFLANLIEDYATRHEALKNYLLKKNFLNRATIIPITDIYGSTLNEKKIDAIILTEENLENAVLINKKRREISFDPLKTYIVPFVKTDDGKNITSERIRRGEIDRNGLVYKGFFEKNKALTLPENLREELQKPLGQIVKNTEELKKLYKKESTIIAVGDIVAAKLKDSNFHPAINIIDFKSRREPLTKMFLDLLQSYLSSHKVKNEQGTINRDAVLRIENAINKYLETNKQQTITVDGEEDLLALPAIMLSPLNTIVVYGQFDQGIVVNVVTEELKKKVQLLIEKFK